MKDMCCIDAFSPTSSSEIKAYFMENLKPIMDENSQFIPGSDLANIFVGMEFEQVASYEIRDVVKKQLGLKADDTINQVDYNDVDMTIVRTEWRSQLCVMLR